MTDARYSGEVALRTLLASPWKPGEILGLNESILLVFSELVS
jgi:hypothetical protein